MNRRSAPAEVFREKGVLKHFPNSKETTLARVSFLIKLQPKAYRLVRFLHSEPYYNGLSQLQHTINLFQANISFLYPLT